MRRDTEPSKGGGWCWAVAQGVLAACVVLAGPLFPGLWPCEAVPIVGRLLLLLSAMLATGGMLALGRNLTPHPEPRASGRLVRHGVFAVVRHPLYCSLALGSLGWALIWQSAPALVLTVIFAVFLDAKSRVEEAWLCVRFPEYEEYRRRVRRFIPWIY